MQFLISMQNITTYGLKHHLEIKYSSVFFNPNPPEFVLTKASAIEAFGKKYLKPFGALLAGTPSSDISNQS